MTPSELVEKALREHLRLRLGKRALTEAMLDKPIMLSGGEAEYTARIAVDALAGAGLAIVSSEDLDVVMNQGDERAGWQRYSDACSRLRAASPERTADA